MYSAGFRDTPILVPINFCKDGRPDVAVNDKLFPNFRKNWVREMGLRFLLASLTGEVFGRGVMSAFFHEVGRRRSKKEEFKMSATGAADTSAFSLSAQEGIPSGSDALFVLSADNFLKTENSDIGRGGPCWCKCTCTSGVARGGECALWRQKGIIDNIGQMFRIFPLIGKVLEVCDGARALDFRRAT